MDIQTAQITMQHDDDAHDIYANGRFVGTVWDYHGRFQWCIDGHKEDWSTLDKAARSMASWTGFNVIPPTPTYKP